MRPTEPIGVGPTEPVGVPPTGRGGQARLIAGVATGVVLLALAGFAIGWRVAHSDRPVAEPVPSVAPPSVSAPASAGVLGQYAGQDFIVVRQELRAARLGVQLVFAATGDSRLIDHTVPAAGTPVSRGITVKLYVAGQAPLLTLPDVRGLDCRDGGQALASTGVYPQYPTGRTGQVTDQQPAAGAAGVRWNDKVRVLCAGPTSPGAGTAEPSGPGVDPSGDPGLPPGDTAAPTDG